MMLKDHTYTHYLRVLLNATESPKMRHIFGMSVALALGEYPSDKDLDCAQFLLSRRPGYFKSLPVYDPIYLQYLLSPDYAQVMSHINKLDHLRDL